MSKTQDKRTSLKCQRCEAKFRSKNPEEVLCGKCREKPLKGGTSGKDIDLTTPASPEVPKPAVPDVQALVNEMMWQHGTNLANRGDYPDLLAAAGLKKEQVTKAMLVQASKTFKQRTLEETQKPRPERSNKLVWKTEPQEETWTTAKVHYWESNCGRYRVYRIDSEAREQLEYGAQYHTRGGKWDACECNFKQGTGYPKYVKTLEAAFLSAEKFHSDRENIVSLTSNREAVLTRAAELGLSNPRTIKSNPGKDTNGTVQAPKEKKPGAPRGKHTILGHPMGRVIHWMSGKAGWEMDQVHKVLAHYGIKEVNPATVRTYWSDGKNPKYAKWADLTSEQVEELEKVVSGT